MTLGTYLYPDLFFGGTSLDNITAGTDDACWLIFRMNVRFHELFTSTKTLKLVSVYHESKPGAKRK